MRITAPAPDERIALDGLDFIDPFLYSRGDPHLVWQTLRAQQPVYWQSDPGFWVVSRHHDVRRVLRDHGSFTSERGILLATLGELDPAAGTMVALTDPPRHQQLRGPVSRPLARSPVAELEPWLRELVRQTIAPAWDSDVWDVAAAFARVPVASIVRLMGLPADDVEPLLRWAYTAVAPQDPHYRLGPPAETLVRAHYEIMSYLRRAVRRRRVEPSSDLISHLLAELTEDEVIVNCFNLFLGGAVTTSQAVVATLIALTEQGGGEGRWRSGTPAPAAAEEAFRWSSPTMQFVRYATRDVVLHDVTVRSGDAVCASIASANRDELVFDRPDRFDPRRTPNPHVAFGGGVHHCVGRPLATLTMQIVVEEFFAQLECFELAEAPVHLASNLAAGVVSAPMRLKLRPTAGPSGRPAGPPRRE